MEEDPYHVSQQTLRHKLRFIPLPQNDVVNHHHNHNHNHQQPLPSPTTSALNLSLSTHAARTGSGVAFGATPVGPFTGYASILARSRFLRPAQELLDGFGGGGFGVAGGAAVTKNVLEDTGRLFCEDDEDDISRRCANPNLVSMLHEVYKKYKLYCQQMQSAVTSFESVAGLANAAPFISFAVRAMSRHFHCLKNAILDQIRVTSKVFGCEDFGRERGSGSCSEDRGPYDQKQGQGPNFLQHPVWRSQRGFPDKAVAVLRTWLFEHFLHPYPSDSDKQMLAQKTGLSRSQVSNWFTNARVRLWKPMVEEIHTLERKAQCSKSTETPKFINLSSDNRSSLHPQLTEKDFEIINRHGDYESQFKRTRIESIPREEQCREQFGLPYTHLMSAGSQHIGQLSHSQAMAGNQPNMPELSWPAQGQIIPFWLARQ